MKRGTLGKLAVVAAVGGAAFEIERRRLVRMRDRDPAWHELNQRLEGRSLEATSADGTRLHVEVFGSDSAPTIVFIHGWLETIRLWHHQIRDLSRDFRIVAYDQRGHGESDAPRGEAYTDEALSDDLQAALDACVPHGTQCLVAGHSMGGMTIVAWAGRHPTEVQRRLAAAALINTGMSELVSRVEFMGRLTPGPVRDAMVKATFLSQLGWPARLDPVGFHLTRRLAFNPHAGAGSVAFAHEMFTTTKPVVRAGFGIYYDTIPLNNFQEGLAQNPTGPTAGFTIVPSAPIPFGVGVPIFGTGAPQPPFNIASIQHNLKTPNVQEWNFNIQQELADKVVFQIGYVGNHSIHVTLEIARAGVHVRD